MSNELADDENDNAALKRLEIEIPWIFGLIAYILEAHQAHSMKNNMDRHYE